MNDTIFTSLHVLESTQLDTLIGFLSRNGLYLLSRCFSKTWLSLAFLLKAISGQYISSTGLALCKKAFHRSAEANVIICLSYPNQVCIFQSQSLYLPRHTSRVLDFFFLGGGGLCSRAGKKKLKSLLTLGDRHFISLNQTTEASYWLQLNFKVNFCTE